MTALAQSSAWISDPVASAPGGPWDLLVIGGGTAGMVAAKTAAGFGATVLLVEKDRTGGDCLWTGCVPSKTLLSSAHAAAQARNAGRYGVTVAGVGVDFAEVMRQVRTAIDTIEPTDSPAALRAAGVHVAHGTAAFTGRRTAQIDGITVEFRRALVTTGAAPVMPSIRGLAQAGPLTSETIWAITALPGRLLVLGGGSIGCELGQAFARLGSTVSIVEDAATLLVREDSDAAALVTAALIADGVSVRTGVAVQEISASDQGWCAELADGSRIEFDRILVAAGRRARTNGLGLDAAGIDVDERGYVDVDSHLQTSNPRVWAAGDLTGYPPFTHTAGVHGTLAATNAVLGLRRTVDAATIPRVTFTQPEVAAFGVGAQQAGAGTRLTVRTIAHCEVDRAIAEQLTDGFTRLVLDGKSRVVGATIVGPRAGESLAEVVLAARHGLRARDLAATIHAYPTYSDGVWKAGIAQLQQQLHRPAIRRIIELVAAVRRRTTR